MTISHAKQLVSMMLTRALKMVAAHQWWHTWTL